LTVFSLDLHTNDLTRNGGLFVSSFSEPFLDRSDSAYSNLRSIFRTNEIRQIVRQNMGLTFSPAELKDKLAKALRVIESLSRGILGPGDFGLIDFSDPDFDSEVQPDEVITPKSVVSIKPPDSSDSFDISYEDFIEMLREARLAEIDSGLAGVPYAS
jgi:hypothetical protein